MTTSKGNPGPLAEQWIVEEDEQVARMVLEDTVEFRVGSALRALMEDEIHDGIVIEDGPLQTPLDVNKTEIEATPIWDKLYKKTAQKRRPDNTIFRFDKKLEEATLDSRRQAHRIHMDLIGECDKMHRTLDALRTPLAIGA